MIGLKLSLAQIRQPTLSLITEPMSNALLSRAGMVLASRSDTQLTSKGTP